MHFEDGGRGYEPRNAGSLWKLGKERKQLPLEAPEGFQLTTSQNSDFQTVR